MATALPPVVLYKTNSENDRWLELVHGSVAVAISKQLILARSFGFTVSLIIHKGMISLWARCI